MSSFANSRHKGLTGRAYLRVGNGCHSGHQRVTRWNTGAQTEASCCTCLALRSFSTFSTEQPAQYGLIDWRKTIPKLPE